ncbi:MAG: ABC transporter substrate-binding protein [Uliginosibacterium sp.]|nr:ABC transporter substrate-binding protein [Uliginosibacterium sp.]
MTDPERRAFLRATGAIAAATALALPAPASAKPGTRAPVSVLLPGSDDRHAARTAFLSGFQSAISRHSLPLAAEILPFPGSLSTLPESLRQHLSKVRSTALVGLLSRNQASSLEGVLDQAQLPSLICDIGADVVRGQHNSAWLLRHSLGYWQTSHAMGAWSAAQLGQRALIATDYLESGHDLVYAFHRGFVSAGGYIPSVHVSNSADLAADLPALFEAIRAERPDFVYALYSGTRAKQFLAAYSQSGLGIPLAGPALLTQAVDHAERFPHAEQVIQAASWPISPDTPCCPLALLGFEAALRLANAFASAGTSGEALAHALARAPVDGPRGRMVPAPDLADVRAELHLHLPQRSARSVVVAQSMTAATVHHMRGMLKTGWTAPYLLA